MKSYPQIAARLFGTPLLLLPEKAEVLASVLAERLGTAPMVELEAQPVRTALLDGSDDGGDRPYQVKGGTAVIQVVGELVNRGSWLDALSGLTSYEGLGSALRNALDDPEVASIVLDIDSPGGEAAGAMEAGAAVRQASTVKPVVAFVNGMAASAAYAIASGAPRIVVAPSATVGSIGVVMLHIDRSAQMAARGLKPTLLKKGAYKTDGTSLEPLAAEARERIETLLDVVYGLFASTVAAHRPSLDLAAVKATEAGLYIGAQAVEAGLADAIGTLDDAVRSSAPARKTPLMLGQEKRDMTDIAKADHETAVATATTVGSKAGAAAERARVSAILGHAEAKGRESLAQHLAFETEMQPEAAAAVLKASPKSEPASAGSTSKLEGRVPAPAVEPDQPGNAGAAATPLSDYDKGAAEAKALQALLGR